MLATSYMKKGKLRILVINLFYFFYACNLFKSYFCIKKSCGATLACDEGHYGARYNADACPQSGYESVGNVGHSRLVV